MKKRLIVFVLSALLLIAMLPLSAMADGAYTVSYDANGADSGAVPVDSATYNAGDAVTVYANTGVLGRTGFTFSGWNTASDGTGTAYTENASMVMPNANVILYAAWTATQCTVKFDAKGGTAAADWTGNYGDVIAAAPVTTYEGYDFFGWYTDAAFAAKVTFPYTVTASATLYAKWEPKSAYLSNVTVSGRTLQFVKTVYSYKIQLAETEGSVTITPALENDNAKIQIWTNKAHTAATPSGITVNVDNNKTVTVKIKVTYPGAAENEDMAHVYTFVVKRDKSADAALSSLTSSAGALSPSFDPAVTAYTLSLDSSVKSVTIYATANSPFAKVKHATTVKLKEGQTRTITIRVKPQFGPAKLYTITIKRAKPVSSGTNGNTTGGGGTGSGNNGGSNGKGNNGGKGNGNGKK